MLRQCKFAHIHYQFHLDEMKRESEETDRERKAKAVKEELEQTKKKKKKKKLDSAVTDLEREAEQLARDAKKQNRMSMLGRSNAIRSKAKEKRVKFETEKQFMYIHVQDLSIYYV